MNSKGIKPSQTSEIEESLSINEKFYKSLRNLLIQLNTGVVYLLKDLNQKRYKIDLLDDNGNELHSL